MYSLQCVQVASVLNELVKLYSVSQLVQSLHEQLSLSLSLLEKQTGLSQTETLERRRQLHPFLYLLRLLRVLSPMQLNPALVATLPCSVGAHSLTTDWFQLACSTSESLWSCAFASALAQQLSALCKDATSTSQKPSRACAHLLEANAFWSSLRSLLALSVSFLVWFFSTSFTSQTELF